VTAPGAFQWLETASVLLATKRHKSSRKRLIYKAPECLQKMQDSASSLSRLHTVFSNGWKHIGRDDRIDRMENFEPQKRAEIAKWMPWLFHE
jgi:hypothetical protein